MQTSHDSERVTQAVFAVVVNDEEQHSIWALDRPVPNGWRDVGFHGTKEECLAHIEQVWTDITPRSVRMSRDRG